MRCDPLLFLRFELKAALLFLLLAAVPPSQVLVRAVPDRALIGEPFVVEVTITHPKEQRVDVRTPGDLGDFDLVESKRARVDGPASSTTTFQLKLSAFALGKQKTPDFTFDVDDGDQPSTFVAPGTEVEVVSSLPPDAEKTGAGLFDIRPPREVPIRTWRLLVLLAGLLAAGGLAYLLYRYARRPRPVSLAPVKPVEPLHVRTLAALDALRTEDLPGKARSREFYFQLSEILRGYLGERYAFEAMESTSSELLDSLRTLHTPGLPMKDLTHFAFESDLAKFARASPTADECKASLEFAYRVVYATTPSLAPPPPVADARRPAQLQ